jgi:UDP-N-acetylglucosamine--N-acetylmuramyl-(pentapeptide) pyrophosphoryl-undecaprenol N-acetylglucosamine transferase
MKVMIAAGGTGGHIYPALALAEALKERSRTNEIVFWGSNGRMESRVIPADGYRFYGADMTGMNAGVKAKIASAVSLLKAQKKAKEVLQAEKPDIVVGFGNYISVPLVKEAHKMHIPVLLHEQNSYAGKANRFLAKDADGIAVSYAANIEQMPKAKDKIRVTGNPESSLAAKTAYDPELLKSYGLDPLKPFVVFMMGSLGSSSVSRVIDEALPRLDQDYQVLVAAGSANDYQYQTGNTERIAIVPFIDGKKMLKGCQLAVVRAGATTLAELTAIGTASILIPSPYVPNNHQYYNAMELVNAGAAVMIEEKDLQAEMLAETINRLMRDPAGMKKMRENAKKIGRTDAAEVMMNWMEELVNGRNA